MNDEENFKLCPLRFSKYDELIASAPDLLACVPECAWYNKYHDDCAMMILSRIAVMQSWDD